MIPESIQDPLDSVDQDSDGVEREAVQNCQSSALDTPGLGKDLALVSGTSVLHSRKGWTGGSYLWNIDPDLGCRRRDRLDMLQAPPVDCKRAALLFLRDMYLHSVLRNGTADTSSWRGSQDTEKRP